MKKRYQSLFILPKGTTRHWTEEGWKFESESGEIPELLLKTILKKMGLEFDENYLKITKYKNEAIELIVRKNNSRISKLTAKLYTCDKSEFIDMLPSNYSDYNVYVFDPSADEIVCS